LYDDYNCQQETLFKMATTLPDGTYRLRVATDEEWGTIYREWWVIWAPAWNEDYDRCVQLPAGERPDYKLRARAILPLAIPLVFVGIWGVILGINFER
jgi:hypothetical protein